MDQALAQLETAALDVPVVQKVIEQQVLKLLDLVVERLDSFEVAIDHEVQQTMN